VKIQAFMPVFNESDVLPYTLRAAYDASNYANAHYDYYAGFNASRYASNYKEIDFIIGRRMGLFGGKC
jgi:hypothetical protein